MPVTMCVSCYVSMPSCPFPYCIRMHCSTQEVGQVQISWGPHPKYRVVPSPGWDHLPQPLPSSSNSSPSPSSSPNPSPGRQHSCALGGRQGSAGTSAEAAAAAAKRCPNQLHPQFQLNRTDLATEVEMGIVHTTQLQSEGRLVTCHASSRVSLNPNLAWVHRPCDHSRESSVDPQPPSDDSQPHH